jgi:hypothetical protein
MTNTSHHITNYLIIFVKDMSINDANSQLAHPDAQAHTDPNQEPTQSSPKKEILTIAIEIDHGAEETLHMFEGDIPGDIARQFCSDHNIDPKYASALEEQIKQNLDKANSEEEPTEGNLHDIHNQVIPEEPQKSVCTESENMVDAEEEGPIDDNIADESTNKAATKESPIKSAHKSYLGPNSSEIVGSPAKASNSANAPNENDSDKKNSNEKKNDSCAHENIISLNTSKSAEKQDRALLLYQNGLKSKEELERYSTLEKKKKNEREMEGVTWKPNISQSIKVY